LNQQYYRRLIAGRLNSPGASFLRLLLGLSAFFYGVVMALRNRLYDKGWLKKHGLCVPVISIGNITAGGTGKTPLVIWLCKLLSERGIECAVLTRGYKTRENSRVKTQNYVDEPAIISENCPHASVIINRDRVAGAMEATEEHGAEVLIMDDGFQHRRLARDVDIVTIDATLPFGHGRLLPAGLLREPKASLGRAHAAVITRCDQIKDAQLVQLREELGQLNPDMIITAAVHTPVCVRVADGEQMKPGELKGKRIFTFCGIGNPEAFLDTVKALGSNVVGWRAFDDHHRYTALDIADVCEESLYLGAELVLTTQKDWTKISPLEPDTKEMLFGYLAIELEFLDGREKVIGLIEGALAGKIS
jgi:tetraacyldisaccharide 4'-kinase